MDISNATGRAYLEELRRRLRERGRSFAPNWEDPESHPQTVDEILAIQRELMGGTILPSSGWGAIERARKQELAEKLESERRIMAKQDAEERDEKIAETRNKALRLIDNILMRVNWPQSRRLGRLVPAW
jgi:hypothetical protein